jgi:hypothetical protein
MRINFFRVRRATGALFIIINESAAVWLVNCFDQVGRKSEEAFGYHRRMPPPAFSD